ncbi:hypothetical protein ACLB2K_069233 [Fragaria x ananassa]
MMTWQARSASTPDLNVISRPLFPLPLVLFPGVILPLQIFEFRYRMMMHSLLQTDLRFGVIYSDAVSDSTRALSVEIYGGGSSLSFSPKTDFHGKSMRLGRPFPTRSNLQFRPINSQLQPGFRVGKARKWWEKGNQPNMTEVTSAQDLVDSLLNAGDKLVVLDFFSPGCGGCKALHPKVFLSSCK